MEFHWPWDSSQGAISGGGVVVTKSERDFTMTPEIGTPRPFRPASAQSARVEFHGGRRVRVVLIVWRVSLREESGRGCRVGGT